MTRKRYIKLIMAMGLSRNQARELAAVALADGMTYQDAYDRAQGYVLFRLWQKTLREITPGAAFVIGRMGGVPFIEPLKCPVDGFRTLPYSVEEVATDPAYRSSAAVLRGLDALIPPVITIDTAELPEVTT